MQLSEPHLKVVRALTGVSVGFKYVCLLVSAYSKSMSVHASRHYMSLPRSELMVVKLLSKL